jgi:hypothetical protein
MEMTYRHQIVEIPPIALEIVEYRLYQRVCDNCGEKTRAILPPEVETSGYGERVVAMVSLMSGMYRHSHRMVVSAMWDYFSLKIGLGTVNRLRITVLGAPKTRIYQDFRTERSITPIGTRSFGATKKVISTLGESSRWDFKL